MYQTILAIHSLVRWAVLAGLLFSLYRAYRGLLLQKPFSRFDNAVRHWTATIAHIQLVLGLCLYFISPVIRYFLQDYKDAVHVRAIRFFGMEHSLMMLTAIILLTIGAAKAKRKAADSDKFRTMAIWYTIALIIILINVPWPFSPFAGRPYYRPF